MVREIPYEKGVGLIVDRMEQHRDIAAFILWQLQRDTYIRGLLEKNMDPEEFEYVTGY